MKIDMTRFKDRNEIQSEMTAESRWLDARYDIQTTLSKKEILAIHILIF
jgi:hypothetical protein